MKKILALLSIALFFTTVSLNAQNVKSINESEFNTEIKSGYVLVDFWATWCPPCKMLAPVLDELSKDFVGEIRFVKIDIDKNRSVAGQYQIQSIPTLILFKDGKAVNKWVGLQEKSAFKKVLQEAILVK